MISFISMSLAVEAKVVSGLLEKIGDATHLEFIGRSDWDYQIEKKNSNQLVLVVPAFDTVTEQKLKLWSDHLIKKIDVAHNGPNGQYIVTFDLGSDEVENFDYLTDDPSRLIIDFYTATKKEEKQNKNISTRKTNKKNGPSEVIAEGYKKKGTGPKKAKSQNTLGYSKMDSSRKPAGSELIEIIENIKESKKPLSGIFDGGDPDYNRFLIKDYEIKEESIIASRQNIYIRFPRVKLKTSQLDKIKGNPPEYRIHPKENKENKEARFLQTLYEKKRYAAFIKTFEYFQKKYPESTYNELLRNMLADVYFERWKTTNSKIDKEKIVSNLQYLIDKYPNSVMTERSELTLAYLDLENKDGINTIQRFLKFLDKYPSSDSRDQAQMALADGYLLVNKFKDALIVLEELERSPQDKDSGIEATYRIGDVHFQNENYKKAIESYLRAIEKFPLQESDYANANYNLAEAYFWTGDFKNSLKHYVRFIELFPSHEHGAYALTRIGEVLDILGVNKSKVMGAFLECTYRFKKNEGSEVARIRMLSQRMKNMKDKELNKALEEMREISSSSKLPRMEEFVTLMVADGLHRRGEYIKGLNYLISYYQRNPTSTDVTFFKKRILKNIGDLIKSNIDKKDFLKVLDINSEYSTTWLNNLDRIDIPYFVGQAYEMAGVFDESQKIYQKTLNSLIKILGTNEEKERRVTEHLPKIESVLLRLAETSYQKRQYEKADGFLNRIKNDKNLNDKDQIERVELLASVAEQKGQTEEAKKYLKQLIQAWQGKPELLAPTYIHIASIEYGAKKYSETEEYIKEIEKLKTAEAKISDDLWFKALELKGKTLEKQNQAVAAIETYTQLLEEFDGKRPLSALRFHLGKLMFENGNIRGAEKVWNGLDQKTNPMYVNLAKEKLSNAKWEDDYKKYIQRIPAAESLNRSVE
ncbi:MAG: tetratricopeptide repeat protein [Bdellovibrionaceae bacterium]|nr:tetratricopeptide repeat protein [Pseudobdellovibrionaceae bacterium]